MALLRDLLYLIFALLTAPIWGWRLLATGKWRTDWAGRFGRCAALPADGRPTLLIHAVSVGEVKAVRQLVEQLATARPDLRIVISTTTDTGFAQAQSLYGQRHTVVRYPLDFSWAVKRFLDAVRPTAVALTELEVWPNFVATCHARGIPLAVVNGRLSERGFKRYRLVRPLLRSTFAKLSAACVQTRDYADRFIAMGVPADRVRICDTMKWDTARVLDEQQVRDFPGAAALAQALGIDRSRPIIVAGSIAPGEDELLITTCPAEAQLILVPRKPEWFDQVARTAEAHDGVVRRTNHPDGTTRPVDEQRLFLLDTMGELARAYALADVVIVGRSFLGLYGSDVMEPIALGKPTIIGPYHGDFAETVTAMREAGGIIVTDRPGEAAARLLADREEAARLARNGQHVILSRQGATRRHLELLLGLLGDSAAGSGS